MRPVRTALAALALTALTPVVTHASDSPWSWSGSWGNWSWNHSTWHSPYWWHHNSSEDDTASKTLTGIVSDSGDFDFNPDDYDILLQAVIAADLADVLDDSTADFTLFAPNDRAFIRLAFEFGYKWGGESVAYDTIVAELTELGGGDPIPLLRNILLYHVSPGAKTKSEIKRDAVIDTAFADADPILVVGSTLIDNEPDFRDAWFSWKNSDVDASNGILQTIDRVLIPLDIDNTNDSDRPTIAGTVARSGGGFDYNPYDYDILLEALTAANLVDALDNPADSLTVLAPTDVAFIRTARALGYHGKDESGSYAFIVDTLTDLGDGDPIPLLTAILLYHVLPEPKTAKQVLLHDPVTTALGEATISPDPKTRRLGDNDPTYFDPIIWTPSKIKRASNGFINPISRVLFPVDLETL